MISGALPVPTSRPAVGRPVAVKTLFPVGAGYVTDAQLRAFRREVAVQHEVGLVSDNVVQVLGMCTDLPPLGGGGPVFVWKSPR